MTISTIIIFLIGFVTGALVCDNNTGLVGTVKKFLSPIKTVIGKIYGKITGK